MTVAGEIINGNGISYVGATFFTGLFGLLGAIIPLQIKARREIKEQVSNKIQILIDHQRVIEDTVNKTQQQLQEHLQWHVWHPQEEKKNASHEQAQPLEQQQRRKGLRSRGQADPYN